MVESALVNDYLSSVHADDRMRILSRMRDKGESISIGLSADLLRLKLNPEEHIALLRTTSSKHKLALEDYLTSQLQSWDQNVASAALWEWALRTDAIMWHRTLQLAVSALSPQRVRYTLLDLAWFGGGFTLVKRLADMEGLEDMSVVYLSLICFRALQFGVYSDILLERAKTGITQSYQANNAAEKTLPYFLAYVFRFDAPWARSQKVNHSFSGIWSQFMNTNKDDKRGNMEKESFGLAFSNGPGLNEEENILQNWPSIWQRQYIEAPILEQIFHGMASKKFPTIFELNWEFFAGIDQLQLKATYRQCRDSKTLALALNTTGSLLPFADQIQAIEQLRQLLQKDSDPSSALEILLPRYSALLNASSQGTIFAKIFLERSETFNAFEQRKPLESLGFGLWEKEYGADEEARQSFFGMAYHNKKTVEPAGDDFWQSLYQAWKKPTPDKIDSLSHKARQAPDLFQICFIDTLGRFKGSDAAALKLLDFIRSKEEPILRSIMYALQGIGTPRASQELVAFLTRPNISAQIQLEITQILADLDLSHLQAELKSTLNDLNYRAVTDSLVIELRDAISSLLVVGEPSSPQTPSSKDTQGPTTLDLDKILATKIDRYDLLSSEVKRALRTAQFFHLQIEQVKDRLGTIDLSPAIDMQYKALELCFREKFEAPCGEIIKQGVLQRKLDVIGYARPIPSAMDDFERYIENLPIIHSIPFFSKFKLRKMLRAICQYRPGKRFTLDGLKAFAIFFICFSRSECRYGLNGLFPITSMKQDQLFLFCKELHVFQDFRNRAAHEGFHPDASNNLDSIWVSTGKIITGMFQIADGLEQPVIRPSIKKTG